MFFANTSTSLSTTTESNGERRSWDIDDSVSFFLLLLGRIAQDVSQDGTILATRSFFVAGTRRLGKWWLTSAVFARACENFGKLLRRAASPLALLRCPTDAPPTPWSCSMVWKANASCGLWRKEMHKFVTCGIVHWRDSARVGKVVTPAPDC